MIKVAHKLFIVSRSHYISLSENYLLWQQWGQVREVYSSLEAHIYVGFHEDSGGVSEFFQVLKSFWYRPPLTASAVAKDSSSAISSGVSFTDRAPIFWLKFSILVVPGMGHTSFPWWWTQARANWDGVHPFLVARSLTRSNIDLLCSRFSPWNLGRNCNSWIHIWEFKQTTLSKRQEFWGKTV